jgi:hypothetical protein
MVGSIYQNGRTPEERFWNQVRRSEGCWEWIGIADADGYGKFTAAGKRSKAHRWAWTQTNGPIPEGLNVLHHCDNPPCVRPEHLFLGTQRDNLRDMAAKRRTHKTHCKRGHERWGDNLYTEPSGKTHCRKCLTLKSRRQEQRKRDAA